MFSINSIYSFCIALVYVQNIIRIFILLIFFYFKKSQHTFILRRGEEDILFYDDQVIAIAGSDSSKKIPRISLKCTVIPFSWNH